MDATWAYLITLLAAVIYPIAGLWIKQAMDLGGGVMRTTFVSNFGMGAAFLPLLFFRGDAEIRWEEIGWPLLAGVVFLLAQVFTVVAVRTGGVSIQAPLMGTKVIFVASFATILSDDPIPIWLWIGAGLTAVAVFLLGKSEKADFRHSVKAVSYALISSVLFGLTDSLVATKSALFAPIPYLLVLIATVCLSSFALIPFFHQPLQTFPLRAWRPAIVGGVACGVV